MIKTDEQITREEETDVHLQFNLFASGCDTKARRQLAWLAAREIAYEVAAPKGWLEGNPGCYAVYFEHRDDPRHAAYSATFETRQLAARTQIFIRWI